MTSTIIPQVPMATLDVLESSADVFLLFKAEIFVLGTVSFSINCSIFSSSSSFVRLCLAVQNVGQQMASAGIVLLCGFHGPVE